MFYIDIRKTFIDYCFLYVVVPPLAAGAARREPMGQWVGCPNDLIPVICILIFKSFGSYWKGVGKASPQYQKDSMSFWYLEESFIL